MQRTALRRLSALALALILTTTPFVASAAPARPGTGFSISTALKLVVAWWGELWGKTGPLPDHWGELSAAAANTRRLPRNSRPEVAAHGAKVGPGTHEDGLVLQSPTATDSADAGPGIHEDGFH